MPVVQIDQSSEIIVSLFAKLGVNPPFNETILLRDGFYAGKKFRAGGFQAIWWIKMHLVEVFDEDGQPLETIGLEHKSGMAG